MTASQAFSMTKSYNRLKTTERLYDLQKAKSKDVKFHDVSEPLKSYGDFRGLLLADYRVALTTSYPDASLLGSNRLCSPSATGDLS